MTQTQSWQTIDSLNVEWRLKLGHQLSNQCGNSIWLVWRSVIIFVAVNGISGRSIIATSSSRPVSRPQRVEVAPKAVVAVGRQSSPTPNVKLIFQSEGRTFSGKRMKVRFVFHRSCWMHLIMHYYVSHIWFQYREEEGGAGAKAKSLIDSLCTGTAGSE